MRPMMGAPAKSGEQSSDVMAGKERRRGRGGERYLDRSQLLRRVFELVEVEPVVLQRAPPGLDDRVGDRDFDLGEHAAELPEAKALVDLAVDALGARVGDDGRHRFRAARMGLGETASWRCT